MATVDQIVTQFVVSGDSALRNTFRTLGSDADTLEGKLERLGMASNAALGAGGAILGGVGIIGMASLKAAGNVEMVEKALTRSLGSAGAAEAKIAELRSFAKDAPQLNFLDSSRSFQMLQTMGIETEKIIPLMEAVGDATAAAGKGNAEFQRALIQIGQMSAKGKIQGEELLTLAENGIPATRILAKELGLTAEQTAEIGRQGITSEKAIAALTRGLNKEFGGAAKAGANTLQGQIAALQDAAEQMLASGGKTLIPIATEGIETAAAFIEKVDAFATKHPDIVKNGLIGAAGVGGTLLAAGGVMKAIGLYNEFAGVLGKVTRGKKALEAATRLDDAAEKSKAATALIEGTNIGRVGDKATDTAKKLGVLARTKAFLGKPMLGKTVGAGIGSAALGAAAGYGVSDDYGAMGDPNAAMKGAATGVATAAAAMFLPGAAVPIAIATGFRYAFNELVNRPMERIAEGGDPGSLQSEKRAKENAGKNLSLAERAAQAQMDAKELQRQADAMKRDGAWSLTGDRDIRDLEAQAESKRLQGLSLGRLARQGQRSSADGSRVSQWAPGEEARMRRENAERMRTLNQHNGETVIRIPNRPADVAYRNRRKASTSPIPRYA